MKIKYLLTTIIALFLFACGPNKEELAMRARQMADSINKVEQAKQEKLALLKGEFIELKAQLAGEMQRLESIQGFKLLRTADEKAEQVANQTKVIETLKSQIEDIQSQIKNLN